MNTTLTHTLHCEEGMTEAILRYEHTILGLPRNLDPIIIGSRISRNDEKIR